MRKSSRPLGPADAAARDVAHAQMHALDPRAVDEDLELRPRQRQVRDLRRVELEGQVALRLARSRPPDRSWCAALRARRSERRAGCGPRRDSRPRRGRADWPISVSRRRARAPLRRRAPAPGRSGARTAGTGCARCAVLAAERALHVRLAERHAGLQQVAAVGPQHHDLRVPELGGEQQAVEAVVLERRRARRRRRLRVKSGLGSRRSRSEAVAVLELEVLDPGRAALGPGELVGALGDHAQSEVLQASAARRRSAARLAELDDLQMHAFGLAARPGDAACSAATCASGCSRSASRSARSSSASAGCTSSS